MPYTRPIPERKASSFAGGLRNFAEAEKLMQVAFVLPSAVFVGWLAGAWVGSKCHQGWVQIVGLFLGCAAGMVHVVRMALEAERQAARADREAEKKAAAEPKTGPGQN